MTDPNDSLARKVFLAETAAVREHLAEQEQQATDKAAALLAPLEAKARELKAQERAEHRAAVLREAIDVAHEEGHRIEAQVGIEAARGARCVAYLLRQRLAKGEQPEHTELKAAKQAQDAVLRIVAEVTTEANDVGGVDINDLVARLEQAGYRLPDDSQP